ncbi:crotonobetainyl-CoA:carnitine CoA-transferase CaiB-like acyl-CoA transferase [Microbacterium resistens]|uniref:Crotonobetainyl-CoA:carnitine CoA-transferase CaiB-like acyl-CoA transferase n=1 Tax=Microbacterium resistens TaxID=156977 RepID=A0ABU1SBH9_9MICO|nr:CoA transferase [Microbacterium resistens]MDR6866613.1 crotonobetainyl-CoA:carnitine CoA-transferase CaiB-like acyl-CoA transferase [Microbacterium resistens]
MTSSSEPEGALGGIKVIDLSRVLAGPYATQMMADHGAEVIKVEPPAGDMTRDWGPPFVGDVSAYYAGLNRNKQHLSLDLSRDEGRAVLLRMLADADVLVENFKAGTMERWGLSPETLAELFPGLVYCRITGFGTTGPMGGMPGYDAVLQAYSGIMSINGEPGGGPLKAAMPIVDLTTGMLAFSGVLLALHERTRSGRGQLVDLALLDAAVSLLHPSGANFFMDGKLPTRLGNGHPNVTPYQTFQTRSGDSLFVGGGNDRQFAALCRYLGEPEIADDPRFATNADRMAHREELAAVINRLMEGIDLDEAARSMLAHGVPASRVQTLDEVFTDPQVLHRNMIEEIDGYRLLGVPVKLDRTPGSVRTAPRSHGADTVEVLRAHGYPDVEIEELLGSGIVLEPAEGKARI